MSRSSLIGAVYRKELIDILRDRRTLLAMVIVPVVLYPIIMLGFIRMAESEADRLRTEEFVIEVGDPRMQADLEDVIRKVQAQQDRNEEEHARFTVAVGATPDAQIGEDIQLRIGLSHGIVDTSHGPAAGLHVEIVFNQVHTRSRTAKEELERVFYRYSEIVLDQLLARAGTGAPGLAGVDLILKPIRLSHRNTRPESEAGWALGRIIPIILVLMTITGAIYPAIDLTAGERERGTLETLMATPVPVLHLILGKFLVVATIGLIAATLNITCVAATMHFGGLTQALAESADVTIPYSIFPIILLCMVPFALLFAAILVAVCSFARTFKEAQNYVMPVIILAMIPAIGASMPTVELKGILLVIPVGNMVLLTRELFQQTHTWTQVAVVLISTTLYAAAAVAVAARLFGQEAVLFADAGSYKTLLRRSLFRPARLPTTSQALLLAALLFPASFYAQTLLFGGGMDDFMSVMSRLAVVQFFGLFVIVPLAVAGYFKIDVVETFRLRAPATRAWFAAGLLGVSSWAMAHQFLVWQSRFIEPSESMTRAFQQLEVQIADAHIGLVIFLLAVVPAICEEFLFRGFLLSGVSTGLKKWPAIFLAATIFGIFHFFVDKVPVTALMGVVLGYLCWQSRSILPGILAHALHNGLIPALSESEKIGQWLGLADATQETSLPLRVMIPAAVLFAAGLGLAASLRQRQTKPMSAEASSPPTTG